MKPHPAIRRRVEKPLAFGMFLLLLVLLLSACGGDPHLQQQAS